MQWREDMFWVAAGSDLAKITAIIGVGMPASLLVTAWVAVTIRNAVRTEMEEQPVPKRLPAFNKFHYAGWGMTIAPTTALNLTGYAPNNGSMHDAGLLLSCHGPEQPCFFSTLKCYYRRQQTPSYLSCHHTAA